MTQRVRAAAPLFQSSPRLALPDLLHGSSRPSLQAPAFQRSRTRLALGIFAVIALGLASRKFPFLFPAFFGKYPGDALWALMVFLGWALCLPHASTRSIALLAFSASCLVELSQLYQAPWLNAIRSTTLGHLVLGSTFSWFDIAAYAVGVLSGWLTEPLVRGMATTEVSTTHHEL
ncbi:MAG: DUF2809 domain-containing protein [Rhodocyclaceae bacterium]